MKMFTDNNLLADSILFLYSQMQKTRISRAQILTNERKSYFLFFVIC